MGLLVQQSGVLFWVLCHCLITYMSDNWNFNGSNPCLHVGGNYNQNGNHGLFYVNYNSVTTANDNIGSPTLSMPSWQSPPIGTGSRTPHGEN